MVVVLVKCTHLPGAGVEERERRAFTGYATPYWPVELQATHPECPGMCQKRWGERDPGWGHPVFWTSWEALNTVLPSEQPVASVGLFSKHPNSVLCSWQLKGHRRNKESGAVGWAGKWLIFCGLGLPGSLRTSLFSKGPTPTISI